MSIQTLLNEEIKDEFSNLKKMELGSETYKTTVDGLTKLVDRAIEMEKMESELQERIDNRETDNDLKLKQMKDEKTNRFVTNAIAIAGIVIPSLLTVWGTMKTLKFEEEGTVTTIMGRGFINKLLPKK